MLAMIAAMWGSLRQLVMLNCVLEIGFTVLQQLGKISLSFDSVILKRVIIVLYDL